MRLLVGAADLVDSPAGAYGLDTFDGKVEGVSMKRLDNSSGGLGWSGEPTNAAEGFSLDFFAGHDTWSVRDRLAGVRATLHNGPSRLATSHTWAGGSICPATAPDEYSAIHFHSDDVLDAQWSTTASWSVPADTPSGFYAARVRTPAGNEDRIPFIVRSVRDGEPARVGFLVPTFTYAAYGNEDFGQDYEFEGYRSASHPGDELLREHPEWGGSSYDVHPDGTGRFISSMSRPLPCIRPDYRYPLTGAPRGLGADLYISHWLEQLGESVDFFGDEDLHAEGAALLEKYVVVVSGTHPEYVTDVELTAIETFTRNGGRFMYLGGNGFYWVTSQDPTRPDVAIEVRRSHAGTRAWEPLPGEQHHQFTGEPGGLWRHRGKGPHKLFGVGFVSQGWDGHNPPFVRTAPPDDPRTSWAFEGIEANAVLGETGLIMNGAAGDEIDSFDPYLGSPLNTLILASSSDHSDAYIRASEDTGLPSANITGSTTPAIHSDCVIVPRPNGGAVFAVGSMCWAGCFSADDYDNPLVRLTNNVLAGFLSGGIPWDPGDDTA